MSKRELLEACAKATGRTIWNPLDDDGDCFRMTAQMRVNIEWSKSGNCVSAPVRLNDSIFEMVADHPTPAAAARMAVCRAVAATEKS